MGPFLFLFVQSPARSFCVSSPGTSWANGSSYSTPTSTGTTQAVLAGASCRPFFRQGPHSNAAPAARPYEHFSSTLFHTSRGASLCPGLGRA